MKRLLLILLAMIPILDGCGVTRKSNTPVEKRAELVYCSFSETRHGGLGKDYCELVADPGKTPLIHVRMNIGNHLESEDDSHSGDFKVNKKAVLELQDMLEKAKVSELDGYNHDEMLCGGSTCRIYMEYSDGKSVNAIWSGHEIKKEALAAYAMIERFFQPWIKKCY